MTIPQHLQFSVLTAPLAAVDRRGLSQAWYSALYGHPAPARTAATPERTNVLTQSANELARERMEPRGPAAPFHVRAGSAAGKERAGSAGMPERAERRAQRSPLARKIERTFLHPGRRPHKAVFELENGAGRVQILLRGDGNRVKLIALCPRGAATRVAVALAQARYALARRGVALDAETRERASC